MEFFTIVDTVVKYLRDGIITGEFSPGQKLNEKQLAMKFNISRPPLREAFRILEKERMIISVPRKGRYVSLLSLEDLDLVYQARMMIEFYAMDILKGKGIRDFSTIAATFNSGSNLDLSILPNIDSKERMKYLKILADFHSELVESTQNHLLIQFYKTITHNLARYQYLIPYSQDSYKRSQEHHSQILAFIEIGDFDQAKECLRTHLRTYFDILRDKMVEGVLVGSSNVLTVGPRL